MEDEELKVGTEEAPTKPAKTYTRGLVTGFLISFGVIVLIAIIGVFTVFRFSPEFSMYKNTSPDASEIVDNSEKMDMDRVNSKLEVLQEIVNNYFLFDADAAISEEGVYKGYMESLGDKYSTYYTAEEFERLTTSMSGVFYGIGAVVQQDPDTKVVTVVSVVEGSPAEEAGVLAGDIFYEVDGEDVSEWTFDSLVYEHIRGEKGTDVTITFIRDGKKVDITITRGEVPETSVYSELKEDDIGYIEVSQFTEETPTQFKKAIDELLEQDAKALVIDLRDNTGGVLTACVDMIDYILPDGVKEHEGLATYTADKRGIGERYYTKDGHEVDMPIVLLVNGFSASASEVFTGAMIDYKWAAIVGTKTFGKGIVQSVLPLGDGSAVKLTVEHYYTPDGTDLHGEGLTPDYVLEINEECKSYTDENDNQYAKALQIIEHGKCPRPAK